jgi:ribulose-phosphate 3-epimerase
MAGVIPYAKTGDCAPDHVCAPDHAPRDSGAAARGEERVMTHGPRVAARILAADLACLGHEVAAAIRSGADRVHVDVMELDHGLGVGVGPRVCRALRRVTRAPLEVHLLVKPVESLIAAFADAGGDVVAFHPEASDDVRATVTAVKEHGCEVGLALAAGTPLDVLDGLLDDIDLVLVTLATPGLDGQRFMPSALRWIRTLRERISAEGCDVAISVDGGVGLDNAAELVEAGADTLVVESALCRATDRAATIAALKGAPPWRPSQPPVGRQARRVAS